MTIVIGDDHGKVIAIWEDARAVPGLGQTVIIDRDAGWYGRATVCGVEWHDARHVTVYVEQMGS